MKYFILLILSLVVVNNGYLLMCNTSGMLWVFGIICGPLLMSAIFGYAFALIENSQKNK
jgi:hypothetical protein